MVLSNKRLKQRLRSELQHQQRLRSELQHQHELVVSDTNKPTPISKREKKRLRRQQLVADPQESPSLHDDASAPIQEAASLPEDALVIQQGEIETYHRCIENVLHTHDGPEKRQEIKAVSLTKGNDNHFDVDHAKKSSGKPTVKSKSRKQKKTNEVNPEIEPQEQIAADESAEQQESSDPRTVYVGGIPYYSSEDDIRAFFGDCGTISELNQKTFSDSGKFRGIALLTFKTVGGAQRALALNGASMGDCFLKIQPSAAKPKEVTKKEVYTVPPSKTEGYTRAYIGNLSWDITEQDIRDLFKDCKIDSVRFSQDKMTGDFQGFGHVDFADDRSLELALRLDQEILLGRPIKVAYAILKKSENRAGASSTGKKDITCYACGEKGHISSRCSNVGKGS